ncbi:uncharacterized protein MELLADRAFT_87832 [Melampsora larici-populina 98AG31]|uniref:Uncharacterized protein n=1 Tax=Melampsora larici-populina (strain 98AG31 / pathotype 3-4-7) TaxID=747676 RepID=F4RPM5_MELLP|nr:uncharacterized protein MELLADRAFT_87832 [Melampsora larici-populina 98AG31]EGG05561.1 hypothetical protein MELLADRAFT_87832 [Melampsora larici-populina 98AG31]
MAPTPARTSMSASQSPGSQTSSNNHNNHAVPPNHTENVDAARQEREHLLAPLDFGNLLGLNVNTSDTTSGIGSRESSVVFDFRQESPEKEPDPLPKTEKDSGK